MNNFLKKHVFFTFFSLFFGLFLPSSGNPRENTIEGDSMKMTLFDQK